MLLVKLTKKYFLDITLKINYNKHIIYSFCVIFFQNFGNILIARRFLVYK